MSPELTALVAAGIVTQSEAERIDRTMDPDAERAYAEHTLTDAFAHGLTAQQRRILQELDATGGNPTPANLERLWAQEDELLWRSVQEAFHTIAIDHAVSASLGIGGASPNTWQLVNEEVVNYVDTYYTSSNPHNFGSIPNLNDTSRQQFADAFQAWQLGDRTPGNYADGLPQLIADLQPIFGQARAEKIGITETTRLFSFTEISAGNANEFVEGWQYLTANDGDVDEECASGNNTVMMKGETTFPDGGSPPPRHVRCRCSMTQLTGPALAALREGGFIDG